MDCVKQGSVMGSRNDFEEEKSCIQGNDLIKEIWAWGRNVIWEECLKPDPFLVLIKIKGKEKASLDFQISLIVTFQ